SRRRHTRFSRDWASMLVSGFLVVVLTKVKFPFSSLIGRVGFHCIACEITFPSAPTMALIGAYLLSNWVRNNETSNPNLLFSRKLKFPVKLPVYFLSWEPRMIPFWFKYPADRRYFPYSEPPETSP